MTIVSDHDTTPLYDGEDRMGTVSIDLEAESLRSECDEDLLHALKRAREAAEEELQAVQDEIDEDGEVSD